MKRRNEKDLSKEQAEALDDDDGEVEEAGTFQRASAEEMAGRKKLTLKKRPSAASAPSANPFAAFGGTPNPFAVLASKPAASSTTLTLPPLTANTSSSAPAFTVPLPATTTTFMQSSTVVSAAAEPSGDSELTKKRKKLNEAFLKWAERQLEENAVAIWKDGVRDYIQHQTTLREKYGEGKSAGTAVKSASAVTSQPAPAAQPASSAPSAASALSAFPAKPATTTTTTSLPTVPAVPSASSFTFGVPAAPASTSSTTTATTSATTAAPAPLFSSFSFPAPPVTNPGSSFTFNSSAPATAGTSSFPAFPSFSFTPAPAPLSSAPLSSAPLSSAPANTAGEGEDGEGDEEGEPMLAPEKVLRNEQDKDEILLDITAKLFNYSSADKEWRDMGKGSFRVTRDPATKKQRMVMRNGTGKIIFNAAFFKNFKVEEVKGALQFSAFVAREEKGVETGVDFKRFLCRANDANRAQLKKVMEEAVASFQ